MKHILIVEDSFSIRELVAFLLKSDDIAISKAEDGLGGLELAKKQHFDLMISDHNMQNMNGLDLVVELRKIEKYQTLPILMLSTESDPALKQRGRDLGLIGWIVKPVNPDNFKKTIEKILYQH